MPKKKDHRDQGSFYKLARTLPREQPVQIAFFSRTHDTPESLKSLFFYLPTWWLCGK